MKVILHKSNYLDDLESKVNASLEKLEEDLDRVRGITYSTDILPITKGERVVDYKPIFSVMIAYEE